jgi:ATP diphosphatase
MEADGRIETLLALMARLRDPETGCAWDVEQSFETIAPYTLEEAHEVVEAIARGDMDDLRDELGDLLLQVVFHARMAEEAGSFAFSDVVSAITAKMIRRHPHVFGPAEARSAKLAKGSWQRIKAEEKAERAERRAAAGLAPETPGGVLAGVQRGLGSLQTALKLQQAAATVGFDWNDPRAVIAKLREELDEFEAEIAEEAPSPGRVADELGDLFFALVNLARHHNVDPDMALAGTNAKFRRRFGHMEAALAASGRSPAGTGLDEMEALWQDAKATDPAR